MILKVISIKRNSSIIQCSKCNLIYAEASEQKHRSSIYSSFFQNSITVIDTEGLSDSIETGDTIDAQIEIKDFSVINSWRLSSYLLYGIYRSENALAVADHKKSMINQSYIEVNSDIVLLSNEKGGLDRRYLHSGDKVQLIVYGYPILKSCKQVKQ